MERVVEKIKEAGKKHRRNEREAGDDAAVEERGVRKERAKREARVRKDGKSLRAGKR